jgi:hypothetical protein
MLYPLSYGGWVSLASSTRHQATTLCDRAALLALPGEPHECSQEDR